MDLSVQIPSLMCVDIANGSLTSALSKTRILPGNHAFIRRLTGAVGIADYRVVEASETYVAAIRRDGLRELRIHSGHTIGFTTGAEARRVGAGADTIRQSYKLKSTWLVSHPQQRDLGLRGKSAPPAGR